MMNLIRRILVLTVVTTAPACYYDADVASHPQGDDYPLPSAGRGGQTPAASAQLPDWPAPKARRELAVLTQGSSLVVTVVDQNTQVETPRTVPVEGGTLGFASDAGALTLDELQVVLGEVHVPTANSGDIVLTGIRLESKSDLRVPITWREPGHQGFAVAPVSLTLEWQVIGQSGRAWPLTPQTFDGATLHLHVAIGSDGRLRADALGIDTGTIWARTALYALKDAVLTLEAREAAAG